MKKGTLKVAKGAIAVGMSFVLIGTMNGNVTTINANGEETVIVHREERALPEKFELEKQLEEVDFKEKKNNKKGKTKVLVRPKNINRRYL